jgi:ParB-like chromosome segregation protein Spo0J
MAADDTATSLDALTPDPDNARSHDARNLDLITEALRDVGAARSIVVDEHGVVLAGNATVQAATQAGLSRVRIIEADGTELIAVRRTGLTPGQKTRLALYDNRTAELASWDTEVLAALADEVDLSALWDSDELADLLGQDSSPSELAGDPDAIPEVPDDPVTGQLRW